MRRGQKGFTLLEMLVVIGLLVIVTTIAVPHFKKCYDDIRLSKTLDDLDSLVQSVRSYYLVMNEMPEDEDPGRISEEVGWAMQANFLGKMGNDKHYSGNFYNITIKNWSGYHYDWDFWYGADNFHPQWALLFEKGDKTSKLLFLEKMRKRFGSSLNECTENSATSGHDYLNLSLVEIPKVDKENRYY